MIAEMSSSWFLQDLPPYCGDLYALMSLHWAGTILILVSVGCGMAIGLEREVKNKPAGLRTLALICAGSTIFTIASIVISGVILLSDGSRVGDRGRIAAQIVSGVGFLGAGAIIRDRGSVVGFTTGATIWVVAAIGVIIGTGHAAAGVALTAIVLSMLTLVRSFERHYVRTCQFTTCRVIYTTDKGLTRLRLLAVLDRFRLPDHAWQATSLNGKEAMDIQYCHYHREHRAFLYDMLEIPQIEEVIRHRTPREEEDPSAYED